MTATWPDDGARPWGHDEATLPSIGELTSGRPADRDETIAEVRHQLGIGGRRVRHGELPDVGDLAEGLGLR